jgi:hypothetical protein
VEWRVAREQSGGVAEWTGGVCGMCVFHAQHAALRCAACKDGMARRVKWIGMRYGRRGQGQGHFFASHCSSIFPFPFPPAAVATPYLAMSCHYHTFSGARGLRAVLERLLMGSMFEVPGREPRVHTVVVDEAVVRGDSDVVLLSGDETLAEWLARRSSSSSIGSSSSSGSSSGGSGGGGGSGSAAEPARRAAGGGGSGRGQLQEAVTDSDQLLEERVIA